MDRAADFHAVEGEPIRRVLTRFARYVRREGKVTVSGPARVIRTKAGRQVVCEPPMQSFPGSFRVLVEGRLATIGPGLVSGQVPRIEGERIDGMEEDGETPLDGGVPRLDVEPPEEGRRSWVAIAARPSEDTGEILEAVDEGGEATVEMVHLLELPEAMRDEETGRIYRLVAELRWRGDGERATVESVRQIVWYDQETYLVAGHPRFRAAG